MKTLIVIVSFFYVFPLFAQDAVSVHFSTVEDYLFPEEADYNYTLGHNVSLRKGPSIHSSLVDTLPIGTRLKIYEQSEIIEVKQGISSHWYRVKTDDKTGWIWGGLIAKQAFRSKKDRDVVFLCGFEKYIPYSNENSRGGAYYQIRAVKGGVEKEKIIVKSFAWDFAEVSNIGAGGLSNVDDIITLRVPCRGGCGCSTGEIVVFWSKGKLHKVADLIGTPDGEYSEGSYLVFPNDMEGVSGQVIKVSSLAGDEDEEGEGLERLVIKEYYIWNGKKLLKLDKKTDRRKYIIGRSN